MPLLDVAFATNLTVAVYISMKITMCTNSFAFLILLPFSTYSAEKAFRRAAILSTRFPDESEHLYELAAQLGLPAGAAGS
jgi:hypothetical protein